MAKTLRKSTANKKAQKKLKQRGRNRKRGIKSRKRVTT
jgi:hypothetical protein